MHPVCADTIKASTPQSLPWTSLSMKWGNINWRNAVHPSSELPERWRICANNSPFPFILLVYCICHFEFTKPEIGLYPHQSCFNCVVDIQRCYRTRRKKSSNNNQCNASPPPVISAPEISHCAACLISRQLTATIRLQSLSPETHNFPILTRIMMTK